MMTAEIAILFICVSSVLGAATLVPELLGGFPSGPTAAKPGTETALRIGSRRARRTIYRLILSV